MFLNLSVTWEKTFKWNIFFSISIYIRIDLFTILAIAVSIILQSQFLVSEVALSS